MIATDKSQSARLLQCGVPAESADMAIDIDTDKLYLGAYSERVDKVHEIPAFSLSALLGLMPKEMGIAVGAYPSSDKHTCFTLIDPGVDPVVADTAIEAVVQMIEQLTANGYKLNEI